MHPTNRVTEEIVSLLGGQGFRFVEGPDIDTAWHCFTALNIPAWHPARQEMDTFYAGPRADEDGPELGDDERYVLRTHTSTAQIRTMQAGPRPTACWPPGGPSARTRTPPTPRCSTSWRPSSSTGASTWATCAERSSPSCATSSRLDDLPVRFRPSHFPFTEPSAEVDIGCRRSAEGLEIRAL